MVPDVTKSDGVVKEQTMEGAEPRSEKDGMREEAAIGLLRERPVTRPVVSPLPNENRNLLSKQMYQRR
jgi:hypothetical protein